MEFDELMRSRYPVRKFDKERSVPDGMIDVLTEAVCIAPTAENRQPLRAFVIKDRDRLEDVKRITKYHYSASLTIALGFVPEEAWTREDGRNYGDVDASIAAMELWLKAEDMGLGAVWMSNFDPVLLRKLFPETEGVEIVALMQIGFPDEKSRPVGWHTKKRDRDEIVTVIRSETMCSLSPHPADHDSPSDVRFVEQDRHRRVICRDEMYSIHRFTEPIPEGRLPDRDCTPTSARGVFLNKGYFPFSDHCSMNRTKYIPQGRANPSTASDGINLHHTSWIAEAQPYA